MVASSQRRPALGHPTATTLMHRHRERIAIEVLSYVCPVAQTGPVVLVSRCPLTGGRPD